MQYAIITIDSNHRELYRVHKCIIMFTKHIIMQLIYAYNTCMYIYIYIYRERERERTKDKE